LIELIIVGHQLVVSRITQTPLYIETSMFVRMRLSIDSLLLVGLIFCIGGVIYEGRRSSKKDHHRRRGTLESLVFPGRTYETRAEINDEDPTVERFVLLDKFERYLFGAVIIGVQVAQWMFILWICSRDNLFLEALVMTTSFICHGMIISKRKHLKPISLCTLAATAMFYTAARFSIPFQYSQFFHIIIGLILVYTLYRVSHEFEKTAKKKLESEQKRINKLESRIDDAWRELERLS